MRWEDDERISAALEKLGIAAKYVQEVDVSLQLSFCPIVRVQVVAIEPDAIAEMLTALAESDKIELHLTVVEIPTKTAGVPRAL